MPNRHSFIASELLASWPTRLTLSITQSLPLALPAASVDLADPTRSVDGLPTGLSYDGTNIIGTPTTAGIYKIAVRDTATYDGQANTHLEYEQETFTMTITDTPAPRSRRGAGFGANPNAQTPFGGGGQTDESDDTGDADAHSGFGSDSFGTGNYGGNK